MLESVLTSGLLLCYFSSRTLPHLLVRSPTSFTDTAAPIPLGEALPRSAARRQLQGRGRFVDDVAVLRLTHAAFLRSPVAHARIRSIDANQARAMPGVVAIFTGEDLASNCNPWRGVLTHLPTMQSAPQWPLARERVRWVGEPIAIVIAERRALAEDAVQAIAFEWETLPALTDPAAALAPEALLIQPELGTNLMFEAKLATAGVEQCFAGAAHVIEAQLQTRRVTAVSLEPRAILAQWQRAEESLTVTMSTQVPYMMQAVFARVLGLADDRVHVTAADTGGSFGLKIHTFGDEMAVAIAARLTGRSIKFVADRLESFVTDVHARAHQARVRLALDAHGTMCAFDVDDLCGAGPFSIYPRGSVNESRHVTGLVGACYRISEYRAHSRVALQNKNMYGQYRGVGHPLACLFTEALVDLAARKLGIDPVELRRRNLASDDAYPRKALSGANFERLSLQACLEALVQLMRYDALRAEQTRARRDGQATATNGGLPGSGELPASSVRGIGVAVFVENSNHSSTTYGRGGAPIATQDGAMVRLTHTGGLVCAVSLTDSGQGVSTAMAQIAAAAVGVGIERVQVVLGDTLHTPFGGANWGSRGTGIAGEATWQAGLALKAQLIAAARALKPEASASLTIRDGTIVDETNGAAIVSLAELAHAIYFRPDYFPREFQPEPLAARHYAQKHFDGIYANGAAGCIVDVDLHTGFVTVRKVWVVDDCGTVINPLLVDEQIRGSVVHALGQALFESCEYGSDGALRNGTLADYLVPLAAEMPDIEIDHVCTPTRSSALGAKGAGEAGVTGALAAVVNAVNDALAPFDASVLELPITPERVLAALRVVEPR